MLVDTSWTKNKGRSAIYHFSSIIFDNDWTNFYNFAGILFSILNTNEFIVYMYKFYGIRNIQMFEQLKSDMHSRFLICFKLVFFGFTMNLFKRFIFEKGSLKFGKAMEMLGL